MSKTIVAVSSLLVAGMISALFTSAGSAADDTNWGAVTIARETIQPGETRKFAFVGSGSFEGSFINFSVFVARGKTPGPTLCVTSGIHGDEINSVEIARRVFAGVDAATLRGMLVVLPAINSFGFRTMNRYLPDRRDLNRYFPGSPNGSVAAIIADAVFSGVIRGCSQLIDLHTGSRFRSNVAQIRADADSAEALALARHFGVGVIITGRGPSGSLRREAMDIGIPAIIYEAGPPYVFVEAEIASGTQGIRNVMIHLGMIASEEKPSTTRLLKKSRWLRVPRGQGGIYLPVVKLGDSVTAGQLLATVTDPVTDTAHEIRADEPGIVIGMALPQVVLSGYGLFHVGEMSDQ